MIKLIHCDCKHTFQDSRYGMNVRVANGLKAANDKVIQYRCTVCLKIVSN